MSGGYDDQTANDEFLANALQEEENEAVIEGEESEEETTTDEEVVITLTDGMTKISKGYDVPDAFKQSLLDCTDPNEMQGMIDNITALLNSETAKLRVVSASKRQSEKLIAKSNEPVKVKGESVKKKAGKATYTVVVNYNGKDYEIELKGRATFKMLREKFRLLYPDVFGSDAKMKQKMTFKVVGKEKSMNASGRTEMLAWGASHNRPLVIRAVDGAPPSEAAGASSSSTAPKTKAKPEKKSKKDDKSDKTDGNE